jgi:hypothetical protein
MSVQNNFQLNGLQALPFGVIPAQLFLEVVDPTAANYNTIPYRNFQIGSFWLNTINQNLWYLANIVNTPKVQGNWIRISSATGTLETLTSNSGGAVSPLAGNINIVGDGVTITGVGNPATHTITLSAIGTGTIETLTGNSGGAVSPTAGNINIVTANSTVTVVGNPGTSTMTLDFGLGNLFLGSPGADLTSGDSNVLVGRLAGTLIDSGGGNTGIGLGSLSFIRTGSSNIGVGLGAGSDYTSSESDNIVIGSLGVIADANTIRIGTQGSGDAEQDTCYIAGITGVNVGSVANVVSIATGTGQLGTTAITAGAGITITPGANTIAIAATGASAVSSVQLTLTNVQIKNLKATPVTVIAAQGAGTTIWPIATIAKLNYGGTNAFVNTDTNPLALYYTNNAGQSACADLLDNSAITATASTTRVNSAVIQLSLSSAIENLPLVVTSLGSNEISGNAANDNTITINIIYKVVTI